MGGVIVPLGGVHHEWLPWHKVCCHPGNIFAGPESLTHVTAGHPGIAISMFLYAEAEQQMKAKLSLYLTSSAISLQLTLLASESMSNTISVSE